MIQTERLSLSVITQDDLQSVFDTMNFQHTAQTISFMSWPMTKEQAQNWCDVSKKEFENKTGYLFLARNKEGAAVGCIGIHHIGEDGNNSAETGYWVSEHFQGQGHASEMLTAIIDHAFKTFNLESLFATVIPDNLPSRRVLEKHGFIQSGSCFKPVSEGKTAERLILTLKNS